MVVSREMDGKFCYYEGMKSNVKDTMTSMNISLPESMKQFIDEEVSNGGYGTTSEYFRELVREAKKRKEEEQLEKLLLQALESGPATPMTKQDWEAIRNRGLARIKAKKASKK
jgi:antitoxin ParD1/3/4